MADELFLSYKLNGFTPANMLRHYEKMLRLFPYSRLAKSPATFRVIPVSFAEPAVAEEAIELPGQLDVVIQEANEFRNPDSCYRLETAWDLWQFDADWSIAPARASLNCFGPDFEDAPMEEGLPDQLQIEFGPDIVFLPDASLPNGTRMAQSNIKSLLKLVHDLDNALNVDERRLWSESSENFADRLQQALEE